MAEHEILQQKVYHDGRQMIVLQPGDTHDVPPELVADWIGEKVIADPEAGPGKIDDGVREPAFGDTVTSEDGAAGWYTIRASWIDEPIKKRGADAAAAEVARLEAMIPADPEAGPGNDGPPV